MIGIAAAAAPAIRISGWPIPAREESGNGAERADRAARADEGTGQRPFRAARWER